MSTPAARGRWKGGSLVVGPLFFSDRMIVVDDVFGATCNVLFSVGGARTRPAVFLRRGSLRCSEGMFVWECEAFKSCRVHETTEDYLSIYL